MATKVAALETAIAALEGGSTEAVGSLARIAHALRGSGGTFGFPGVSAASAALETEAEREGADAESLGPIARALVMELRSILVATPEPHVEILLIDDASDMALLARQLLAAPSRTISVATTWAEGRRVLAERDVSLLLLDLVLPDADGRNALLALREDPRTAAIPVFVISGKMGRQPRSECLALGAECYFEKPLDLDGLAAEVTRSLRAPRYPSSAGRIDDETGLLNRAGLRDAYERLQRAATGGHRAIAAVGASDEFLVLCSAVQALGADALAARWERDTVVVYFETSEGGAADRLAAMLRRPELARCAAGVVSAAFGDDLTDLVTEAQRLRLLAEAVPPPRVLTPSSPRAQVTRRPRVLVAEDDALIAALVKHRLERDGVEVLHFDTGTGALDAALAEAKRLSCVVLDVKLPGLDGFAVLERLRASSAPPSLPVVMLTSMGEEKDVVRGLALGADDYVVKPFSPTEFAARVHRLIARGRSAAAA